MIIWIVRIVRIKAQLGIRAKPGLTAAYRVCNDDDMLVSVGWRSLRPGSSLYGGQCLSDDLAFPCFRIASQIIRMTTAEGHIVLPGQEVPAGTLLLEVERRAFDKLVSVHHC
jgi:hypothetical protein